MKRLFYLLSVTFGLSACTSNKDKTPVLGNFDSLAIAMDTTLQLGLESSYEFHKTLKVSDTLVYDIVGWGLEYSDGEYAIIRRGADNKADTATKQIREGVIEDALLYNIGSGSNNQIYIVFRMPGTGLVKHVEGFMLPSFRKIEVRREFPAYFNASKYQGRDSFYFADNTLYRQFPIYMKGDANCCPTGGDAKISYRIVSNNIKIENLIELHKSIEF